MENYIVSLWAVVTDGPKAGLIPVQRRATWETGEDGFPKIQSHPGVLQPLVAGKGEQGEGPAKTLLRETEEEAGKGFADILHGKMECGRKFYRFSQKEYTDKNGNSVCNYNFVVKVSQDDLEKIKLHAGAESALIFLKKEDVKKIRTTKEMDGKEIKEGDLVMFPDHLSVMKGIAGGVI